MHVTASVTAVHEVVLIATSDGELAADVRPLVRFNVSVLVEQNGRREQGYCGTGGRFSLADLVAGDKPLALGREAVRQALVNLEAMPAPAGPMTVVLGPGWPGILLHEAIGHGLEGDFNRKGTSAFANRIGERVAAPGCTIVDDGTLSRRRGSLNIDDEGTPTQCTTLIEDGMLRGYIQDKLNARLMGAQPTGNGRRESFAHLTLPRMTNTYMRPGPHDPQEIIRSVERGIYAVNFGGGQVDITSGKFVFSASEAYAIENGKLGAPLKGATLIGNGPDVLTRVSMVGNDLKLDDGVGTCGKDGQSVPVGVGQPTLRIDGLTVGRHRLRRRIRRAHNSADRHWQALPAHFCAADRQECTLAQPTCWFTVRVRTEQDAPASRCAAPRINSSRAGLAVRAPSRRRVVFPPLVVCERAAHRAATARRHTARASLTVSNVMHLCQLLRIVCARGVEHNFYTA